MVKVQEKYNDPIFQRDSMLDTLAMGVTETEIYVAGNLKERRLPDSRNGMEDIKMMATGGGKKRGQFLDYGFTNVLADFVVQEVSKSSVYRVGQYNVFVIEECVSPKNNGSMTMLEKAMKHQEKHAELKLLAFLKSSEKKLLKIAVTKPACHLCHKELSEEFVAIIPTEPGTNTVTNWERVEKHEVEVRGYLDRLLPDAST